MESYISKARTILKNVLFSGLVTLVVNSSLGGERSDSWSTEEKGSNREHITEISEKRIDIINQEVKQDSQKGVLSILGRAIGRYNKKSYTIHYAPVHGVIDGRLMTNPKNTTEDLYIKNGLYYSPSEISVQIDGLGKRKVKALNDSGDFSIEFTNSLLSEVASKGKLKKYERIEEQETEIKISIQWGCESDKWQIIFPAKPMLDKSVLYIIKPDSEAIRAFLDSGIFEFHLYAKEEIGQQIIPSASFSIRGAKVPDLERIMKGEFQSQVAYKEGDLYLLSKRGPIVKQGVEETINSSDGDPAIFQAVHKAEYQITISAEGYLPATIGIFTDIKKPNGAVFLKKDTRKEDAEKARGNEMRRFWERQ